MADGADMALIDVEVVDAQGNRCPTALNPIQFEVTGPAEWRGGIAQGPDNCILSIMLPLELRERGKTFSPSDVPRSRSAVWIFG